MRALWLLLLARIASGYDTPGNTATCNGTCPCGANPPDWRAALPWLAPSGSGAWTAWCPRGCATPEGGQDTAGEFVVDVAGALCGQAAFAAWNGSAAQILQPYGCPLDAFWRLSLRSFSPCVNATAVALGQQPVVCGPCFMPPPPPPAAPTTPAPAAPPPRQLMNATLCVDTLDGEENVTAVSAVLSSMLGVPVSSITIVAWAANASDSCPKLGPSPPTPAAPMTPTPPAPGPLAALAATDGRRLMQASPPTNASNSSGSGSGNTTSTTVNTSVTAVTICVAVQGEDEESAVSAALQHLATTPEGRDTLARALHPPTQRSGSASSVFAPPPDQSPPPPLAGPPPRGRMTIGRRLLPVRIVIAVLVSVPLCCCLPLYLLGTAAWHAMQQSTCLIGIRCRMCDNACAHDREELGRCIKALLSNFAHAQLRAPHVKSLALRMLNPPEAARFAPWLWPVAVEDDDGDMHEPRVFLDRNHSLSTVDEDVEKTGGGSLLPDVDIQACFELTITFRWPAVARRWRAAVTGGLIAHELRAVIAEAAISDVDGSDVDDSSPRSSGAAPARHTCPWYQLPLLVAHPPALNVSVVLHRHRPPPAGADDELSGQPLRRVSRRRTLYVQEESDDALDSFPLCLQK